MAGLASDSTKSAKSLAKQIARQMAREPLEVLKTAGRQVGGAEKGEGPQEFPAGTPQGPSVQEKAKIEAQGQRQLAALEAEIKEIQKRKQEETIVKVQEEQALAAQQQGQKKELPNVPSKPSRKFFGFGKKAQAEKQKTRVERPLPPSG